LSYLHPFFGNAQSLPKEQMQNLKEARFMRAFLCLQASLLLVGACFV